MRILGISLIRSIGAITIPIAVISDSADRQAAAVRDSAGAVIVENGLRARTSLDILKFANRPTLILGDARSGPTHEFQGVTSAVRLSDGTIVVANTSSAELRYFRPDGTLKASTGRRGQGPGEFSSLAWIQRVPGDSVLAYDRSRRFSLFDASGKFVRSHAVAGPPIARFADGSHLVSIRVPQAVPPDRGVHRDSSRFVLYGPDGAEGRTLGLFPGSDLPFTVSMNNTAPSGRSMLQQTSFPQPFGRTASSLVYGNDFLVADGSTYEIRVFGQNGVLKRIVRLNRERPSIGASERAAYLRHYLASVPADQRENVARTLAGVPFPSAVPAFGMVRVALGGRLWVEEYPFPPEEIGTWMVYGPDGHALATATLPAGFRILDIGADYALGLRKDDSGRELIVLLAVEK